MAPDVYEPCPCGSGKKLKFCCLAVIDEMVKVAKLHENNQMNMALQVLDGLGKSHPNTAWVRISKASILLTQSQHQEAKELLQQLLEETPDHANGIGMYALACLASDGYEASKTAINRAFQHCVQQAPDLLCTLAGGVAAWMKAKNSAMAMRQYLALAMRYANDAGQEHAFSQLLRFDSSREIPYPQRGVHNLAEYSGPEETLIEVRKARKLSNLGCWEAAANRYARLAEQDAGNAALWQNTGLCRAWSGDDAAAADALHRAARLHDDFETAVECETIAQLLDFDSRDDDVCLIQSSYDVKSVGRLLTSLDQHDRIVRRHIRVPDGEGHEVMQSLAGVFQILDRPQLKEQAGADLTLDAIPLVLGEATVFTESPEHGQRAEAMVVGRRGEEHLSVLAVFTEAAGDEITVRESDDGEHVVESIPREFDKVPVRWHLPEHTPLKYQKTLEQEYWDRFLQEIWPATPLAALGDKTPLEVASDPELKTPLMAAVYVLDVYCNRMQYELDVVSLLKRLQLDPLRPLSFDDQTSLNPFSVMQLHRVELAKLEDNHLLHTLNRALLIRHDAFLHAVLTEVMSRPSCQAQIEMGRIYLTLLELCRQRVNLDEAFEWVEKAREHASTEDTDTPFGGQLEWDMWELMLRAEDPDDPQLQPLLKTIWDAYGEKLPKVREVLQSIVSSLGIAAPWEAAGGIVTPQSVAEASEQQDVWTPDGAADADGGEKKLWLPGQD